MIISTLVCIISLSSYTTLFCMDPSNYTPDYAPSFHSFNPSSPLSTYQSPPCSCSHPHNSIQQSQSPQTIIKAATVYLILENKQLIDNRPRSIPQELTLRERRKKAKRELDRLAQKEAQTPAKLLRKKASRPHKNSSLTQGQRDKSPQPGPERLFLTTPMDQEDATYPEIQAEEPSINWDELRARLNPWLSEKSEPQPDQYSFNPELRFFN